MRFLLDHDVPERVADVLRQAGHSVLVLREVLPKETSDPLVLAYAREHQLLVVTCNRDDFLELYRLGNHPGVIILIRRKSRIAECAALLRLIEQAGESGLTGNINFA